MNLIISKDDVHLNMMMSKINIGAVGNDNDKKDKDLKKENEETKDAKKSSSIFLMEANDFVQC